MELFGFLIKRADKTENLPSFTPENKEDGAIVVNAGGQYGTYIDLDGSIRSDAELITKYREMSMQPEIDVAIENITNDAIVNEEEEPIVQLFLDDLKQGVAVKKAIENEFANILSLLDFNNSGYEIFRRWYIDGRIYYHVIIDEANPTEGIQELRYIDPRKIRKVREIGKKKARQDPQMTVVQKTTAEYYIYNDKGFNTKTSYNNSPGAATGIRIAKDSIIYTVSGLTDKDGLRVLSYLHKAIKPLNQVRSLEDATIIFRLARAPSRLVWYVDVGNLPKPKAEQYIKDMMTRHKNKVNYNAATGETNSDPRFMTMLDNYWLPRREGQRTTEIEQLEGADGSGNLEDLKMFQRMLFRSLNVPYSRMEPETVYGIGRSTEVSRDEVTFARFIDRIRLKFSFMFLDMLEKQLVLKNIITPEDWKVFSKQIKFRYAKDNYFAELKELEIYGERFARLAEVDAFAGKYVSHEWVRKNILRQSEEDIEEHDEQIKDEAEMDQYKDPELEDPDGVLGAPKAPPELPKPKSLFSQ